SLSADSAPLAIYSLSLHDALPIFEALLHRGHVRQVPVLGELHLFDPAGAELLHGDFAEVGAVAGAIELARSEAWETVGGPVDHRSEEHTSELQSRENLVCRLLLEK